MRIEGLPDDVELLRYGQCRGGQKDLYLVDGVVVKEWTLDQDSIASYLIVRRVEPVCVWQRGIFRDGWVAEEAVGIYWYEDRPTENRGDWITDSGSSSNLNSLLNPPIFRSDLPMSRRIQQVGPTFESQETVQ